MGVTQQQRTMYRNFLTEWEEVFGPTTWFRHPDRRAFACFYEAWQATGVKPIEWILNQAFPEDDAGSLREAPAIPTAVLFTFRRPTWLTRARRARFPLPSDSV